MATPVATCQQIITLVKGDKDYVAVSFDECLDVGVLLSGTPAVAEVTTSGLSLSQKSINAGITLADLEWDKVDRTLTKTGAFAEYVYGQDDTITITDGTGAITGSYRVSQKINDHTITLDGNIGDGAHEEGDTDATLNSGLLILGTLVPVNRAVIFFVDTSSATSGTTYRVRITVSTTANSSAGVKIRDVRIRIIAPGTE